MTDSLLPRSEREQTDESLRLERDRADRALDDEVSEADETADAVISRARARADARLAAARWKTDQTSTGEEPTDALKTSMSDDMPTIAFNRFSSSWADDAHEIIPPPTRGELATAPASITRAGCMVLHVRARAAVSQVLGVWS